MRKLQRSVLHSIAYKHHGGNKMFKYLWKQMRIRQGHAFVEEKPVKPKSALQRAIKNVTGNNKTSLKEQIKKAIRKIGGKKA